MAVAAQGPVAIDSGSEGGALLVGNANGGGGEHGALFLTSAPQGQPQQTLVAQAAPAAPAIGYNGVPADYK